MAIQLVGVNSSAPSTSTAITLSLTALTGGLASSVASGDLVLVFSGWGGTADGNPGVTSPAAIEVADLYANSTHDANLSIAYFVAGPTPPASVTVASSGATASGSICGVAVYRGVDPTTPLDVTTTTATGTGTGDGNPPAITPITAGAQLVCCSLVAAVNGNTYVAPAGYSLIVNRAGLSTLIRAASLGVAHKAWSGSGADDPAAFNWAGTAGQGSWAAATLAIRPLVISGNVKYYTGSSWVAKPVKHWNGTTWVQKPLKVWNGTSWVRTSY